MMRVLCTVLGEGRERYALIELADGRFAIVRAGELLPARFGRDLLPAAVEELILVSGVARQAGGCGVPGTVDRFLSSWA
jgi:hypothetical protein